MTDRTCSFADCSSPHYARGLCRPHYDSQRRNGSAELYRGAQSKGLWERIDKNGPGGCWLWLGFLNEGGYGTIFRNGSPRRAHRYVYELLVGPIPVGLEIDHLCRVRNCVNPAHLEPVTREVNNSRRVFKTFSAEACSKGHPLIGDNLRIRPSKPGWRICRTCAAEHEANRPKRDRSGRRRQRKS